MGSPGSPARSSARSGCPTGVGGDPDACEHPHTLTSNPNRTSPVKRGQWIPPATPRDAAPAPPAGRRQARRGQGLPARPLRERMEAHRADPRCTRATSRWTHSGFAFGELRRGRPLEGPRRLLSGRPIRRADRRALSSPGLPRLKRVLKASGVEEVRPYPDREAAEACALGRGLEASDSSTSRGHRQPTFRRSLQGSRTIIYGIVECRAFQTRGVAR